MVIEFSGYTTAFSSFFVGKFTIWCMWVNNDSFLQGV